MKAIKPEDNNGSIRIRWTLDKHSYSLSLKGLTYANPVDLAQATATAAQISADISIGNLDTTLERYRNHRNPKPPCKPLAPLELWDRWVDSLDLTDYTKAGHYHTTRRALERDDLFNPGLSAFTHNLRRRQINKAYEWAISEGLATTNPYRHIRTRRQPKKDVRVFTLEELSRLLAVIEERWPCYTGFMRFLVVSGCRFGEAAGLQGQHVNLESQSVYVCSSVRYNIQTKRLELRQGNKTETYRTLESPQLTDILVEHGLPADPLAPVFTSPKGKLIRRNTFRAIVWKPALELANVTYRPLHVLRHTVLSMALASGSSVPDVAYLAGHRDSSMVVRTYGHIVERPKLPSMGV